MPERKESLFPLVGLAGLAVKALPWVGRGAAMELGGGMMQELGGVGAQQVQQVPQGTYMEPMMSRADVPEGHFFTAAIDEQLEMMRQQAQSAITAWGTTIQSDPNADPAQKAVWWMALTLAQKAESPAEIQTCFEVIPEQFHSTGVPLDQGPDSPAPTPPMGLGIGGPPGAPPAGGVPMAMPGGPMIPPPGAGGPPPRPRTPGPGGPPMGMGSPVTPGAFSHVRQADYASDTDWDNQAPRVQELVNPVEPDEGEVPKRYATREEMVKDLLSKGVPLERALMMSEGLKQAAVPPPSTPPPTQPAQQAAWIAQRTQQLQAAGMDPAHAANQAAMEAQAATTQPVAPMTPAGPGGANATMPQQAPSGYQMPMRTTHIAKWSDHAGNPLEVGGIYHMRSPEYELPDVVKVLGSDADDLRVAVHDEDSEPFELTINPNEAQEMGYAFEPLQASVDTEEIGLPERTAGAFMTMTEQEGFINEPGVARNINKLNLDNTHYETTRRRRTEYTQDDISDLLSRIDPAADPSFVQGNDEDFFLGI